MREKILFYIVLLVENLEMLYHHTKALRKSPLIDPELIVVADTIHSLWILVEFSLRLA